MNQKLHRLAYPERYKLSSGAKLKSFRIPNILDPYACITTLFYGRLFDNIPYMGNNLLKQYEDGELTEEEVVNKLFSLWEQIDKSLYPLLAQRCRIGWYRNTQAGTGSGGSTSQSSWTPTNTTPPAAKDNEMIINFCNFTLNYG